MIETFRLLGPAVLAVVAAALFDFELHRRRLAPPGFSVPWRRSLASFALASVFFVGVFQALGNIGLETEVDVSSLGTLDLFFLHGLLLLCLAIWIFLGFGWRVAWTTWMRQLGLRTSSGFQEVGIGLVAGIAGWVLVMAVMLTVALGMLAVGGEGGLPQTPPSVIVWIAGLPILLRFALSLSAGVCEELFFRGFLQPRAGIALSTLLFVLAHASYESPFMLVGVTVLSLLFAALVRWRQNIVAAVVAHAVFDAVQMLMVIPSALEFLDGQELLEVALIAASAFC